MKKRITIFANESLQEKLEKMKKALSYELETQVIYESLNRTYERIFKNDAYESSDRAGKLASPKKLTREEEELAEAHRLMDTIYEPKIDQFGNVAYKCFDASGPTVQVYNEQAHLTFLTAEAIARQFSPDRATVEAKLVSEGKTLADLIK